jgi:hypothetical protein
MLYKIASADAKAVYKNRQLKQINITYLEIGSMIFMLITRVEASLKIASADDYLWTVVASAEAI